MKKNVRQTSILSYNQLQNSLSDMQQSVLVFVNAYPDSTDREIARHMGKEDPNAVRPRRFELCEQGLVVCSGKRVCEVSGKVAYTWRVKRAED